MFRGFEMPVSETTGLKIHVATWFSNRSKMLTDFASCCVDRGLRQVKLGSISTAFVRSLVITSLPASTVSPVAVQAEAAER